MTLACLKLGSRTFKTFYLLLTLILSIMLMFLVESPAVPASDYSTESEWVVTGNETYANQQIVLSSDLVVRSGGNLTLINVTLLVNCSYDGEFGITVEAGGCMNVLSGSVITAYDPAYHFYFYVEAGAVFRMFDSELHYCGYGIYGVEWCEFMICTSDAVIANSLLSRNLVGVSCFRGAVNIINCTIEDNQEIGISCYETEAARIIGCIIRRNKQGVACTHYVENVELVNCTIYENSDTGVLFEFINSENVTVQKCTIYDNGYGIKCCSTHNITIQDCIIRDNHNRGLLCTDFSSHIHIHNNEFIRDGIVLGGGEASCFVHDIANNMVNGKPLIYLQSASGITVSSSVGQLIIVNSENVTVINQQITDTDAAIELAFVRHVLVEDCRLGQSDQGIFCISSSSIRIHYCTMEGNTDDGILASSNSSLTIESCIFSNNYRGLCIARSSVEAKNCTFFNNDYAVWCQEALDATLNNCTITANEYGVWCTGTLPSTVNLTHCNIYGNRKHGVFNNSSSIVMAMFNWWGSPDGPEYTEIGDPEDPEEVYCTQDPSLIIYELWLREPYGTKPSISLTKVLSQWLRTFAIVLIAVLVVIVGIIVVVLILMRRREEEWPPPYS